MARAVGYSPSTTHAIWKAFSLKPHRSETFKLSKDPVQLDVHRFAAELEQAVLDSIDTVNEDPGSFHWHKSADNILASTRRFCIRTLETKRVQDNHTK